MSLATYIQIDSLYTFQLTSLSLTTSKVMARRVILQALTLEIASLRISMYSSNEFSIRVGFIDRPYNEGMGYHTTRPVQTMPSAAVSTVASFVETRPGVEAISEYRSR